MRFVDVDCSGGSDRDVYLVGDTGQSSNFHFRES